MEKLEDGLSLDGGEFSGPEKAAQYDTAKHLLKEGVKVNFYYLFVLFVEGTFLELLYGVECCLHNAWYLLLYKSCIEDGAHSFTMSLPLLSLAEEESSSHEGPKRADLGQLEGLGVATL